LSIVILGARWAAAGPVFKRRLQVSAVLAGSGMAVVGAIAALAGIEPQPHGNFAYDLGIGPPLLRDTYLLGLPHLPTAPRAFWLGAGLLGVGGLILLIGLGALALAGHVRGGPSAGRAGRVRPALVASVCTAATFLAFLLLAGFLDRYLLWLVPPVLAMVAAASPAAPSAGRRWLAASAALIGAMAIFGVAAGHDYFAWNRSRWAAVDYLMVKQGVPPSLIDGGFEFNGWYGYDPAYRERPGLSWWWVHDDAFLLAFGPVDGYVEVTRFPYTRLLPPGDGAVIVLQRSEGLESGG
jgi:hypothetical protein